MSLTLVISVSYYARQKYAFVARVSLISVGINLILNSYLIGSLHLGAFSVAVATSLSSFFQCFLLLKNQPLKIDGSIWRYFQKRTIVGFMACFLTIVLGAMWLNDLSYSILLNRNFAAHFSRDLIDQVMHFTCLASLFSSLYWGGCRLLGIEVLLKKS
jgi:peptidoglycan biosynthesis protein MviN/MurJ (putative lipid II flippase)